ncbi:MAG: 3'(2'),5'-bisphosphate nucleotidase CysQ [Acidimicrobiaceae bacterium]|nr:3'(2'),5'-bisphosphate nucleotidase CysQ [Acidimicrobiaceae bacterium]MBT5580939.1 3'(2'),5'-bisphosphate nucleotidase CysQ [Acidimicrobiaceae bacterium]MBT5851349.1 3'(2'),5'-bisphosphate nucleotidase CysQ [Acidimicrobiaceae bacterium]
MHPTDDHQLAAALAEQAGALLLELRARLAADDAAPAVLKAEGDRQAHELLMQELTEARPGDAILSEEGKDDKARLHAQRTWIVDPLDGTREYSEVPRTDWAVHVALVTDNRPVAGAVALPGLGLVLSTADVPILAPTGTTPARMIVSRSRPPAAATHVADLIGADLVQMGSAGAKAMAVVRGECEIYVHSGGQYEWDSCAPVAVAAAAGCHVSRLDGSELLYNQDDVYLPDLIVCRPELAESVLAALTTFEG